MRVRPHVHSGSEVELGRAELVDEDERADHAQRLGWQHAAHLELAEIVRGGG